MSLRGSMFVHLLKRGLLRRGDRPLIAFIALAVAATMITAMLNLYYGLENKLNRDFRSYGANITIAPPDGKSLPRGALEKAKSALGEGSLVVPFAFAIAHTNNGNAVVVGGTDMSEVQRLNNWWLVSKWPNHENDALAGVKAERSLTITNGGFDLNYAGRVLHLNEAGTLKTGAEEENRIYIPLSTFERWTGIQPSVLEISTPGSASEAKTAITNLQSVFPDTRVRPVRQLLEAEGAVIARMRSVMLASTLLITITVVLCVFSTLTSSVLERRRDFAVMKAIGSSQWTVNALFTGEALSIAVVAAVLGYALGSGVAAWISEANFHAAVAPQLSVFPMVIVASVAVALVAALLPLAQLQRIQPAGILKGE
jgi:putative ABC transport system permease protein